jgi:limonene-1,2-epoxide hydrolase
MTTSAIESFVHRFLAGFVGDPATAVDRLVENSSGLTVNEMLTALGHPDVAAAGRTFGVQLMADLMHPTDSLYFDSIYGAYRGQRDIRGWLVPTMSSVPFLEFVPTHEAHVFADGSGHASVDEWKMVIDPTAIGGEGEPIDVGRGVSVRRYRDGWINWSCDVYDTGPFRTDPNAGLPPVPEVSWRTDPNVEESRVRNFDFEADCRRFHETDSEYHDPIFGTFRGRDEITAWLLDVMPKCGDIVFEPLGPIFDDGEVFAQEWVQKAIVPNGGRVEMTRGTSVRRYRDGAVVYAADYFDTAPLSKPDVLAAAAACGSTLSLDDIMRWRER